MSTTARTLSPRRTALVAAVLAALAATSAVGASSASALVPDFHGVRANAVLTSAAVVTADVVDALEQVNVPADHLLPITKNLAQGTLQG